jgi:hypothetical protein
MRQIIQKEIKLIRRRQASITLEKLFESYDLKLQRMHRSDNCRKQYRWLKGYFD